MRVITGLVRRQEAQREYSVPGSRTRRAHDHHPNPAVNSLAMGLPANPLPGTGPSRQDVGDTWGPSRDLNLAWYLIKRRHAASLLTLGARLFGQRRDLANPELGLEFNCIVFVSKPSVSRARKITHPFGREKTTLRARKATQRRSECTCSPPACTPCSTCPRAFAAWGRLGDSPGAAPEGV